MATNKTGATAMPMSMLTRKETFCRVPLLDKELQQLVSAGEGSPYWLLRAEWSALKPYTRNKNRLSKSCLYVSVTCIQTNMHALTIMTFKWEDMGGFQEWVARNGWREEREGERDIVYSLFQLKTFKRILKEIWANRLGSFKWVRKKKLWNYPPQKIV